MNQLATLIAGLALLLASFQAYLSYSARDDHLEAILAGQRMNACAELGTWATRLGARAKTFVGPDRILVTGDTSFDGLREARDLFNAAAAQAGYVLPEGAVATLEGLKKAGDVIPEDIFAAAEGLKGAGVDTLKTHLQDFAEQSLEMQRRCREAVLASR